MPRNRLYGFVVALALVVAASSATLAGTLEVRSPESGQEYRGELTRAYEPCLAPNDVTTNGLPACSPTVTSQCVFGSGSVRLSRGGDSRVLLSVDVRDVAGPSPCLEGPYTLQLHLRVTANDEICAGGRCTFEDLVLTQLLPFAPVGDDLHFGSIPLDDILPIEDRGLHYEVLGATITGVDSLPMAVTGIGEPGFDLTTAMGAGYERCDAPDTSGGLGAACTPAWPSICDTNGGTVAWRYDFPNFTVEARFSRLSGGSPACADGTYVVESTVSFVTVCASGALCTTSDVVVPVPVTAKHGKLAAEVPLASLIHFTTPLAAMAIRDVVVKEPGGALFATAALNDAPDLAKLKVVLQKRDPLSSTDDRLRLEARISGTAIDPTKPAGLQVTLTDRNGPVYDATIPGSLWQLGLPIGTRWSFADPAGMTSGVTKASIQKASEVNGVITYKLKLEAKGIDLGAADLPGVNVVIATPLADGSSVTRAQRNRFCKRGASTAVCK